MTVLLIHRGEVVSTDRLIDQLSEAREPPTAAKTVQHDVSQLRKALGDDVIVPRGSGYLVAVRSDQGDVGRFEALAAGGCSLQLATRRLPTGAWARRLRAVAWGAVG